MGKDERIFFFPLNFSGQKFLTWTPPKKFLMVFLNSPCWLLRNAQKRHKKPLKNKIKKKKGTYLPHLVAICQMYAAFSFQFSFSSVPLGPWLSLGALGTPPGTGRGL
jgi:hypothetical protein